MKKQIVALFILSSSLAGCANQNHFHEYGDWVVNGDVHERLCSCGDKISESHDYDNGRVTKEATHVENGEKIFTCSTCGYEKSEVISKIEGHIFNQMVMNDSTKKKEADCSSPAEYYFSCVCGVVSDTESFHYGNSTSHAFTSGITLSGTYKTSYFGGELFSFTGATFKGHCDIENKDVVLSENELNVIYQNNKTSFSCGDTKVTIALKSNPDVKKVLDVVVDHNLEWDFSSPLEDTCTCSICGENDVTFSKTLTSNVPQELETAKTCSLNLSGVSAYKSVVSIKLGKYDLGTNVNSLNFSNVNSDPEVINGENQTITVVVKDLKDINHTISVPVKLCTKKISTEADVFSIAVGTATQGLVSDSGKYLLKGYYVQTNDIVITTGLTNSNYTFDWNYAFGGTYEGNNYTIKAKSAGWGVFGNLYNATVNNVKIEDSMYTGALASSIFAKATENCTLTNVDVKVTGGLGTGTRFIVENSGGAFAYGKVYLTKFVDCDWDYTGQNVATLLSKAGGTFYNNFDNCTFKCNSYKMISGCPAPDRDVYTDSGITITGSLVS